jgi:hypothetical protein
VGAEQSPEEAATGFLRVTVGGIVKRVPTLKIAAVREWKDEIARGPSGFVVPATDDDWTAAVVAEFTGLSIETVLDLVVAYDKTGALGGREWLEQNADPSEVYEAALAMAGNAFPFWTDVPAGLAALVVRRVVESKPPSSTNGRSPGGDSTRRRSRASSTRRSSTSSGAPARSG